ncbi:MAG: type II secretion system protein GspG [Candidatus Moduliflexus flocculans]|nr:type II secretion system protein GspG [Candidatus Moduliflexus flocculans]
MERPHQEGHPRRPLEQPLHLPRPGRNGGYEILSYAADGREGGEGENADINSCESNEKAAVSDWRLAVSFFAGRLCLS